MYLADEREAWRTPYVFDWHSCLFASASSASGVCRKHSVDCRQRGLTVGRYRTEVNRPVSPACPALRPDTDLVLHWYYLIYQDNHGTDLP